MNQRKKFDKTIKEQTVAKILTGESTTCIMAKKLGIHYSTIRDLAKACEQDGVNAFPAVENSRLKMIKLEIYKKMQIII